jgi:hypothetical protein
MMVMMIAKQEETILPSPRVNQQRKKKNIVSRWLTKNSSRKVW